MAAIAVPFFSSAARMFAARFVPASRFLPSSVARNEPSASTRRTMVRRSSFFPLPGARSARRLRGRPDRPASVGRSACAGRLADLPPCGEGARQGRGGWRRIATSSPPPPVGFRRPPRKGEVGRCATRQHRIDQIMPRALVAEIDLQAIVEKGEEVEGFSFRPPWIKLRHSFIVCIVNSLYPTANGTSNLFKHLSGTPEFRSASIWAKDFDFPRS